MSDHRETSAGALSGVAAGILIIALTAMALMTFQPARMTPMQSTIFSVSASDPSS